MKQMHRHPDSIPTTAFSCPFRDLITARRVIWITGLPGNCAYNVWQKKVSSWQAPFPDTCN